MADAAPGRVRKKRADGQRNREILLEVAKAAFAEEGPTVALDRIAEGAGVGIGTFYRHFKSRDALIQAVYEAEVEQITSRADKLLQTMTPGAALHAWMHEFVGYIAAKKLIIPAFNTLSASPQGIYESSGQKLTAVVDRLVSLAKSNGEIDPGTDHIDVIQALIGFTSANIEEDWERRAARLIDIFVTGLRQRA